ncbi:MAG: hypothetical protein QOF21_823 [Actinomycetota bacterium]|jgi:hypothetical protein
MHWGKRFTALFVVAIAATSIARVPAHADAGLALKLGQAVFWTGPHVDSGTVTDSSTCSASTCPSWPLTVVADAARLRVAIDNPRRDNTWTLEVVDPKGAVAGSGVTSNTFAAEVLVSKPAAGTWTVRAVPTSVTDSGFRLRAKLERVVPAMPTGKIALLPNLKTVPAYEFGFIAPANPLNAVYPPDTVNPPLDVAGVHPLSCAADEMAPIELGGGGATKCLRLTSGPINVGSGPFDMLFDFVTDTAGAKVDPMLLQGPMRQVIHFGDGTIMERPAGTYSFHKTHAHFHTDQVLTYELFRVDNATTGAITATGVGSKSGFCPADQLFGDWNSFTQLPSGTFGQGDSAVGGNCFAPQGGQLGLSVGWGDVYRWQRPGQYVEFGGQGDGLYVVRTTADKYDHVLEENETDNTSYSYIQVTGESVKILERGQGLDPWDKTKIVFTGDGPAAREMGGSVTYVDESSAAPAQPTQVADAVLNNESLPRTGATSDMLAVVLTMVTAASLVLRRRVTAAPRLVRRTRTRSTQH